VRGGKSSTWEVGNHIIQLTIIIDESYQSFHTCFSADSAMEETMYSLSSLEILGWVAGVL